MRAGGVRYERATSPSAAPEGAEETEVRSRATDERPETLPPLAGPKSIGRGGSPTGRNTRCTPRPPLLSCPPEGREEEEEEVPGCGTSVEVHARGEAPAQGEQSLKGVTSYVLCRIAF